LPHLAIAFCERLSLSLGLGTSARYQSFPTAEALSDHASVQPSSEKSRMRPRSNGHPAMQLFEIERLLLSPSYVLGLTVTVLPFEKFSNYVSLIENYVEQVVNVALLNVLKTGRLARVFVALANISDFLEFVCGHYLFSKNLMKGRASQSLKPGPLSAETTETADCAYNEKETTCREKSINEDRCRNLR
jgi:hypothetical protein